jgi:threonylcarbamoyladenosine tRNA methylthiotransferase MtaB
LVGFPGEKEANFRNTLKLIKAILPLRAHVFPYSPRQGTAAADVTQMLGCEIIKKRLERVRAAAESCSVKYRRQFLQKKMPVLIEGRASKNPAFWEGHTDNYLKVLLKSQESLKNRIVCVQLKQIDKDCILADSVIE